MHVDILVISLILMLKLPLNLEANLFYLCALIIRCRKINHDPLSPRLIVHIPDFGFMVNVEVASLITEYLS